jgi:hypothetical protein
MGHWVKMMALAQNPQFCPVLPERGIVNTGRAPGFFVKLVFVKLGVYGNVGRMV